MIFIYKENKTYHYSHKDEFTGLFDIAGLYKKNGLKLAKELKEKIIFKNPFND